VTYLRAKRTAALLAAGTCLLVASGCTSDASDSGATPETVVPTEDTTGTAQAGQPDTNGDGKVVIGVLSPGDIADGGYFQSFVDVADQVAADEGWTVIKQGSVADTDARNAALALCAQGVDMVALGASSLADAVPASTDPACADTAWFVPSAANIALTPQIMLSSNDPTTENWAAGYAAGLVMKDAGDTQAAFVGGPSADYSQAAADAFAAGIKYVVPAAEVTSTFTGDNDDTALAREATQAAISAGASVVYPFLGGGADAATELANDNDVLTISPGTDKCDGSSPTYDISAIYSPSQFFLGALKEFAAGELAMGEAKVWQMGVDEFPTIKFCDGTDEQATALSDMLDQLGSGAVVPADEIAKLK
jgi:basic membrane protein A